MWQLTGEEQELQERVREVARSEIRPIALEVPDCCDYPSGMFKTLAREGLLGVALPREHGGEGMSDIAACIVAEELARVSGTASLMAAYVSLVTLPIILAGSQEQQRRFLHPLASGEQLGSYALTEPNVGSNPADLETTAERHGDRWVINGQKRFIGNAGLAGTYVVFARTGASGSGSKGLSAFVVPGDAPGLTNEPLRTMGMPGWQLGAPRFDDVEVPDDHLLGDEGDGFKIAMMTFDRSRPTVAAQSVGLAQGAVDLALDYALRRETFGQALIEHQGIQFKLAALEASIAAARAVTYQAAAASDRDDPQLTKLAATAKLLASEVAMRATTEAVQVLGGNGYLKDYPAERMMRDAKVLEIYEGANEIQKLVIARQMVLAASDRDPVWPECMPSS
jgi:alkylation response protein AidB-like acyl-CoA dehydrogenase